MIDGIDGSQTVGGGSLTSALGGNEDLDKEAFLKLLVAQLQNQDPLEPKENSEFVAELAQFSNLEQTIGINDRLDMLSLQNQGLANTQVTNLVGEHAVVRGSTVTLAGDGTPAQLRFGLSGPTAKTVVTIADAAGRVVQTLEAGPKPGGATALTWDGRNKAGLLQNEGRYSVQVQAAGPNGEIVSVSQEVAGTVQSVSFAQGFPELLLDNGLTVPVADLVRVETPTNP